MAKVTKLYSDSTDGYAETIKHEVLSCGNIEGNNNKFYSIEVQKVPGAEDYRVFTHYGRINSSNVYEMRGPYQSLFAAEKEFEVIVKKKLKGKKLTDSSGNSRIEKYERVEVVSPTVGSPNVRGKSAKRIEQDHTKDIIKEASRFDPDVQRLIEQFAQENVHKITSFTSLNFTSNGFETALGPVTLTHIDRATAALDSIRGVLQDGRADPSKREVRDWNNLYLSLIPHDFGRRITQDDWIITDVKLAEEYDLLEQLRASVQMGMTTNTNAVQQFSGFKTDIVPLKKNTIVYKGLVDEVERTKKHDHLSRWKVKNIYIVTIGTERKRFEKAHSSYGNIQEYFHGSQNANLLSILMGGLIIPPLNANFVIAGRMFGNGIYGADSSTKSLNYSKGYWSKNTNKFSNCFLLRVKFAMGKTYETGTSKPNGPPRGYDSITALARLGSLYNNEYIVYKLEQCTITHLLELEER